MADSRRRGVRASRPRLEQALSEADLPRRTQAALAERIADLEGLESVPKDLVSRVFREQPVDPQSIERVARGLGVAAHTLYQTSTDLPLAAVEGGPESSVSRVSEGTSWPRPHLLSAGIAALVVIVAATLVWRGAGAPLACRLSQLGAAGEVDPGRLGVLVARIVGDTGNEAQRFIADRFLEDPALAPFLTVITLCQGFDDRGPGDRRARLDRIRDEAQAELRDRSAHILIWGERRGNVVDLHLVSPRTDLAPQRVVLAGRPVNVDERWLEFPLDLRHPEVGLPDLKRLALLLMQLSEGDLSDVRDRAVSRYRSSIGWLKSSIVADRNLRESLDPAVDPTRWALVNAQLCYKYRLLGDYESSALDYQSAIGACEAVLDVRSRAEFPEDWAAVKTNLGSAWLRLHAYADSLELAVERLNNARREIEQAAEIIDASRTPQLWAVNRRTLGTIFIRLGELSTASESAALFERGIGELRAALTVQRPDYQPLDWALTQQNICLAMYQYGARLGQEGTELVREAVQRCEEALHWLSPRTTALSWGMVQNNIAASTATLAQLEGDPDLLERAAAAFREAQRVYTREEVPVNWAEVEVNLGELHCNQALMRNDPNLLDEATAHTENALRVFMERGVARYQRYAERLLAALDGCDREDLATCACGP